MVLKKLKLDKKIQEKKALRSINIDSKIQKIYDKFLSELELRISKKKENPSVICRDALIQLYMGEEQSYEEIIDDKKQSIYIKGLVSNFDPDNVTLEPEYYDNIDVNKFANIKPYIWLWMMFDRSPAGRNCHIGFPLRRLLASKIFKKCGRNLKIFHDVEFSFGYNISVGDDVVIHRKVLLDDRGELVIGNGVSISDYVNIYSHTHSIIDQGDVTMDSTVIDDGARLTYHSTVLSGVTVGREAMVGALSLVTRDVRNYHVNVGIPAKSVRVKAGVCATSVCTDETCKIKNQPHQKH